MLHHAIVLRSYPYGNKISILDKKIGRIEGIIRKKGLNKNLFAGAYISYILDLWRTQYVIQDIQLINTPAAWATKDLLFLHHLLELCYFFSPLHNSAQAVFELLELLYQEKIVLDNLTSQKIYICDLFKQLGIYSPNTLEYDINFINFILSPLKNVYHINIDNKMKEKIQKWLLECVADNSTSLKLKTISFLKK